MQANEGWTPRRDRVRRAWGIVVQVQAAARDIVRLRIAVEGATWTFAPGQWAEVAFEGWPARAYALANRPGDPLLEFHVQRVPGGMVSGHVVDQVREGARVQLAGPYGEALMRQPAREPLLMIAGGWGLASIKSAVLSALAGGVTGPIHVYHGVTEARELYDAHILANAGAGAVHYVPVVVTPSLEVACRHGCVEQAVESDFGSLSGSRICIAGPPHMAEPCVATALRLGARAEDVHVETFEAVPEWHAAPLRPLARRGLLGALFGRYG